MLADRFEITLGARLRGKVSVEITRGGQRCQTVFRKFHVPFSYSDNPCFAGHNMANAERQKLSKLQSPQAAFLVPLLQEMLQ